jgi:lipopolysaccharide assembly outer membrane protein LptD (OstA)
MTANKRIVQLSLISIGLFLILATYFFYPKMIKNKFLEEETVEDVVTKTDSKERNTFENVEYKGLYDINKPFKVKSEKAYILIKNPDVVYMTNMSVTLDMDDGRVVIITSDKGKYNKVTYDCFFENNVKAIDGETTVLAENLDLLATEDSATVYNNVFLTNDSGSLRADKVYYDFETNHYQISMFSDKKVKIKLIK